MGVAADVCNWILPFEHAYNRHHLHSGVNILTPNARHEGKDGEQLKYRKRVYEVAKRRNPCCLCKATRNWDPVDAASLNPGKLQEVVLIKMTAYTQ